MADFPAERSEGGDLRLTHDPETGCSGCPFASWHEDQDDHRCGLLSRWCYDDGGPALPDCPLRSGSVTVAPPGEESPPDGGER